MLPHTNTKTWHFNYNYYTFNTILHTTLKKYHYRGVGGEIMLKFHYNYRGYTTSKLPAASETQQIELSKDAFPQLLKAILMGLPKLKLNLLLEKI